MTPFLHRTVLILLGTSVLGAGATTAHAELFKPNYPIRLPAAETATLQPALSQGEPRPQLILAAAHRRSHAAPKGPPATVKVRKGDSLDAIADRLGVTVEQLKAANGLKRNLIQPGDVLKNPKAKAAKASASVSRKGAKPVREEPEATPESYTVVHGDTIFSISKRFGVSMDALREANGLSRKAQIHTGQTLQLPESTEAADARAAEEMARRASRQTGRAPSRGEAPVETVEGRSATGRVVTVEGRASSYTVRKGDNLAKIADRLNTTVADLKADNRLKKSAIHPGQVLKGPRTAASKAYVAASGDSIDDVATRFGVTSKALRAENGLGRNARIRAGQKLRLPAGYRDRGPVRAYAPSRPSETPRERPPEAAPYIPPSPPRIEPPRPGETPPTLPSQPQPYTPTPPRPRGYVSPNATPALPLGTAPPAAPSSNPPATDAQISALGRGLFVWPLRGDILSEFGPKAGGQRNDGVNVRAESGAAVRAAAAGDVVYAGDQVPGFGNLVLIKHADGWVTAYGHLSHVDVKMQQRVTQGQQIGQAGSTGGVAEPQLHFEVRYAPSPLERARPIDPKLVLPAG
jgi:murein DD-endopeptidase MepM/ murein hydrolase activator NlpD